MNGIPGSTAPTAEMARTAVLCFLAALAEGFDIQSMGVAAPQMGPALGVTREELGPVFSASILGLLAGALLIGRVADIVGRKWTLIASLVTFGVFSIATAHAWDLQSLLIARVLTGLGLGGAMPNLIALSAESAPPERRAGLVTLMTSGLPFGGAVAGGIAAAWDWQIIFYAGGIAPLAVATAMVFLLPESREFLAAKGGNGNPREGVLAALFGGGRAGASLLLWIAFFFTLLVLYMLLNWLPTLMGSRGISPQHASIVALLFNLGGGGGTLALGLLLDRGRRRLVLASTYAGMGAALAWLAVVEADLLQAGLAGFTAGIFVIGAQLVLYGIAPNYYPASIRGTGVGAAVAFGRLGAIAGPLLAAALLAAGGDERSVLMSILPMVAIGGAAALLLLTRRTHDNLPPASGRPGETGWAP